MKNIIILPLLLLSSLALGQNNYEIFDFQNDVRFKHRGTTEWLQARKGATLGFLDSLYIADKSSVHIVDTRSNQVYHFTTVSYSRLKELRDAAKEQSANILAAMHAQIAKKNNQGNSMTMLGATDRPVCASNNDFYTKLANSIVWVGKSQKQDESILTDKLQLNARDDRGYLTFSIRNNSAEDYYVNVVMYNFEKKIASLCYVIDDSSYDDRPWLFVPSNQLLDLSAWHFLSPSSTKQYMLIATKEAYDSNLLQMILQHLSWDTITDLDIRQVLFAPMTLETDH
jgi:hypothetical protein